jgi:Uma2 family endonuclease
MDRMNLILPTSVAPFRVSLDEPLTDDLLLEICEINDVFHVEREPEGHLLVRKVGGMLAGMVSSDLGAALGNWAEEDGRGRVFINTGFFLKDGSMRGPRWAWISNERFGTLPLDEQKGFPPVCPEFVAEVMSFNYTLPEMQERMQMWLANGVELAWLVDPSRRTVEIYRPGQPVEEQESHTAVYGEGPVGGFVLELGRIWG